MTIPVSVETGGAASLSRGNNRTFGVSRSGSAATDAANTRADKTSEILFMMAEKIPNNFIVFVRSVDEIALSTKRERREEANREEKSRKYRWKKSFLHLFSFL